MSAPEEAGTSLERVSGAGAYLSLLAKGTQFPPGLLMQVGGGMTRGLVVLTRGRTCLGG